jgi:hypothetical protein
MLVGLAFAIALVSIIVIARAFGARSKHNEKRRMREYLGRIESDSKPDRY